MRKILLSLIAIVTICANAWGAVTASYSSNTLTISGSGEMPDNFGSSFASWSTWKINATSIIISDGVASISNAAFKGFNKVTSVTIASSVQSIGAEAFSGCSKLTAITIPNGVTTIENRTFYQCGSLATITVPASVQTVGYGAFYQCSAMSTIKASTPNKWASIDFQSHEGTTADKAHPFNASTAKSRKFYFNGKTGADSTKNLVFAHGLTEIKQYAFYKATCFTDVAIPNSVANIGQHALDCAKDINIYINRKTAPELGTSAIHTPSTTKYLYLRSDYSGYSSSPWSSYSRKTQDVSGTMSDAIGEDVTWALGTDGTLTLNATGANKEISIIREANTSYEDYPWIYFRRLVNKVILRGEIEEVKESFTYCYGLNEIELDQTTIPTITTSGTHATIAFSSRFNQSKNVVLKIKSASLADASASNLGAAPWNSDKLDIELSDDLEISDEGENNNVLLANCSTYVEKPITLQLDRSLTNAQYNTFCSPIALTKEQLNDADIRALTGTSLDGDVLTLAFSEESLEAIEAGKPYLVKPSSQVTNPTFENIAPSSLVSATENTETEFVDFIGVLAPTGLNGGDHNTLFLGADNELFWPEADGNIKGMRAYFSLKGAAPGAKRARIVMNPEVATGVENGVLMNGENGVSHKILRDGQIIIIRDGKEYNVMGIMMK